MAGKTITALGNITDGKLYITDRDKFDVAVANVADCVVELVVSKIYGKRTNPQLRYLHGVVVPMIRVGMQEMVGEILTHDVVYAWLKQNLNARQILTTNGHTINVPVSSKDMNTVELSAFIERCRQFAADTLGIDVPDPIKLETANQALNA